MQIDYQAYAVDHNLLIGAGSSSPNGFCLLWKNLSKMPPLGDLSAKYSLMGNLYTNRGISLLLRGLYVFPNIRRLVISGSDLQKTGEALLRLWRDGIDGDHQIAGLGIRIDPTLTPELINHLRDSVELFDERSEKDIVQLVSKYGQLPAGLPAHGSPRVFPVPEAEPPPDTLPSLGTGRVIYGAKVVHAWLQALDLVMRFGVEKASAHQAKQRELLNLLLVISDEDPTSPYLPPVVLSTLQLKLEDLKEYCDSFAFGGERVKERMEKFYPGRRLNEYDQIPVIIDMLKETPHSRRAVATLWDPEYDLGHPAPPCITEVQFHVVGNKLHMRHTARSQDVFKCMVQDTIGFRSMQKLVADKLGLEMGPLTVLLGSAHIYGDDWEPTLATLERLQSTTRRLEFDPIGDFLVSLSGDQIHVRVLGRDGESILWEARGTSAQELGYQIARQGLTTYPVHLAYVVRELTMAEVALTRGEEFVQDRA